MPRSKKAAASRPMRRRQGGRRRRAGKARESNTDSHKYTVSLSGSWTPQQGITVSNFLYTYWSPSPATLTYQSNPIANSPEFALYCNMYDQFKVTGMRVKLIPRVKTLESAALATAEGAGTITMGKGVIYSVEDRDGIAPSNIASLKRYASCRTHSIYKTISRTYWIDRTKSMWLDCQGLTLLPDIQKAVGYNGGLTVYGESLPEVKNTLFNEPWYDVEVQYFCVFRGKASVKITQVGTQVTLNQSVINKETPFACATVTEQVSAGAVDISGNRI